MLGDIHEAKGEGVRERFYEKFFSTIHGFIAMACYYSFRV